MWIDAHIHIYDVSRKGVSWPSPTDSILYRKITPADFTAAAQSSGIKRAVAIECASEIENNLWTLEYLKDAPEICAVTGHIDPLSPNFPDIYDQYAAYPKFRGIRIGSCSGIRDREQLNRNIGYLEGKHANVVDILADWTDLVQMERLIADHPRISFVIDHIAFCPVDGNKPPAGFPAFLKQTSGYENVYMKISGIIFRTQTIPVPLQPSLYAPVLDLIYDAFGEDRCLYGSDWPVITLKGDYEMNWKVVANYFNRFGNSVLDKVMGANTAKVYKVEI